MDGMPVHRHFPGSEKLMSGPPQWAPPLSSEMACPKMSFQLAPESFWQADGLYIRTANLDSPPVIQTLQGLGTGADGSGQAAPRAAVVGPPQWL